MRGPRRLPVNPHPKAHGMTRRCRSHDEIEIASVEAVDEPSVGLIQRAERLLYYPIAAKGPMVEPQLRRDSIDPLLSQNRAAGRGKSLGTLVAEVVFRRFQVRPVGGSFNAAALDGDQVLWTKAAGAGLLQQFLNEFFGLLVLAFAEMMMARAPLRVDEIERRPILVLEAAPYGIVVVDGDRKSQSHRLCGLAHVIEVFLEAELGRVYADHHQSLILVFLGPGTDVGHRAQPIDAGIGPEIDEDDLSAQVGRH